MLHHLTPSDPHAKRSLVSLVAQGITFFFAHLDIVVATAIEANYMSDTYRKFIADTSPEQRHRRQRYLHFFGDPHVSDPHVFYLALQYGGLKW